jgi:WD40 repeat protein
MKLKGHLTACTCIAGDTINGNLIVTGSDDTNAKVWDIRMKSNQNIVTFKEHAGPINCIGLSPDCKWVASGGNDGALKIWEISTGKVMANFFMPG